MFSKTMRLWDVLGVRDRITATLTLAAPLTALGFSRDGKTLAATVEDPRDREAGSEVDRVRLWDVSTGVERKPITEPAPDTEEFPLPEWRLPDGHPFVPAGRVLPAYRGVAISPDERLLAVTSGFFGATVSLWDVAARKQITKVELGDSRDLLVTFLTDGKTLVTAGEDGKVAFWDVAALLNTANRTGRC